MKLKINGRRKKDWVHLYKFKKKKIELKYGQDFQNNLYQFKIMSNIIQNLLKKNGGNKMIWLYIF